MMVLVVRRLNGSHFVATPFASLTLCYLRDRMIIHNASFALREDADHCANAQVFESTKKEGKETREMGEEGSLSLKRNAIVP